MSKRKPIRTKPNNIDTSLDTPDIPSITFHKSEEFPKSSLSVSASASKTKKTKVHPALLNVDLFPNSLEKAQTDNALLKKYLSTKRPIYLFEALEEDFRLLKDPIVIASIEKWRSFLDPSVILIDKTFGGVTVRNMPIKEGEYLLSQISKSLLPPKHAMHLLVDCVGGSGLIHKIPEETKGRPSLELDYRKRDGRHPFVKFWNFTKTSIEKIRPRNDDGTKKIYRDQVNITDPNKSKDYKLPLSNLLNTDITDEELGYFEWMNINTITASTIAYSLKSNCEFCRRVDTPNHWHTIHRIYKQTKKLELFG